VKFGTADILFASSNSIPPYLRTTESTSSRQPTVSATTASLAEASPRTARPHTGFPMSAHLSRIRLFQRHLRSLVWVWVWVWDGIHSHASLRTRSPSSRHPPFTHDPCPPRSLVCGGQPSPHKPRLVVSHSTCPPLLSILLPPRAQLCFRYCSNKQQPGTSVYRRWKWGGRGSSDGQDEQSRIVLPPETLSLE
jgi:hypothetical protein